MKKFIYAIAFSTLLLTLTSCTADEIEPIKKIDINAITESGADYVPPQPIPTRPKP